MVHDSVNEMQKLLQKTAMHTRKLLHKGQLLEAVHNFIEALFFLVEMCASCSEPTLNLAAVRMDIC